MGIGRPDAPNYAPEVVDRALAAWLRLGSADAAERETGVPASTLRAHKHRHPDKFREIQAAFDRELREHRRAIAKEVVEGIREGVLVCRKGLRSSPDPKDAAALVRALATVDGNLDRFERLDAGSPTSITEDRRADADLLAEIEEALRDPTLRAQFAAQQAEE